MLIGLAHSTRLVWYKMPLANIQMKQTFRDATLMYHAMKKTSSLLAISRILNVAVIPPPRSRVTWTLYT
jgi:hypothetical protein